MENREVKTFLADISPLLQDEESYRVVYEKVPVFRREKADRLRFPLDRAQSAGAWYLLEHAKKISGAGERCSFNLSHSGRYVLVSVGPAEMQIGCDVEMTGKSRPQVARRFFSPGEYRMFEEVDEDRKDELFFRFWVLKESFMKATGQGMRLGPDTFEIGLEEGGDPFLRKQPSEYPEVYYFKEAQTPDGDARIAVCSTCAKIAAPQTVRLFEQLNT